MKSKNKKASIGQKILNPILLMVIFQIFIFWLFVFQLGLFDSMINQSRDFFLQNALSNARQIDNEMWFYFSDLSNFGKSFLDLEKLHHDVASQQSPSVITQNLVYTLALDSTALHVDGVYLELFRPNQERETLHFRMETEKIPKLLSIDNPYSIENMNSLFSYYAHNSPNQPAALRKFLTQIENSNKNADSFEIYGYGNWSPIISMNTGEKSIFFAIPLNYQKKAYGILAIEIFLSRFEQMLKNTSFPDNFPHHAALIQYDRRGKKFNILSKHSFYMDIVDDNQLNQTIVNALEKLNATSQYTFEPLLNNQKYFCSAIQLENSSAEMDPFSTVSFYYLALSPETIVMQDVILLQRTFIFLIVLFILFSIIIALFITKQVVSPIAVLNTAIKQKDLSQSDKHLPETAITEIDLLIDTLSSQNQDIQNFHQMITDTMIATEINLVTFYTDKSNKITRGFGTFRNLLGEDFSKDYILKFTNEEFLALEQKIFQNFTLYSSYCSRIDDNMLLTTIYHDEKQNKYICVKSREMQHGRTLVLLDYTNYVLEQEKIKKERDYDVLTSLLNRFSFTEKALAYLNEHPDKMVGMAMWDLDFLKTLNDTYGHDMGDLYLRTAGEILGLLNPEKSYVARVSGDEFFALLFDYDSKEAMIADIETTHHQLNQAFICLNTGEKYAMSASCGYTCSVGDSYEELKKNADSAMYVSKKSAKGSIHEYIQT